MKVGVSLSGIILGTLSGELNVEDLDAAYVGCRIEYALGDLGTPIEATWGGQKGEQESQYHHPVDEEAFTSARHRENWVRVRAKMQKLHEEGKLYRTKRAYQDEAHRLLREGHRVWMKSHGWIRPDRKSGSGSFGSSYDLDTWELRVYEGDDIATYVNVSPFHNDRFYERAKRGDIDGAKRYLEGLQKAT